jgi:hypothetical protein
MEEWRPVGRTPTPSRNADRETAAGAAASTNMFLTIPRYLR